MRANVNGFLIAALLIVTACAAHADYSLIELQPATKQQEETIARQGIEFQRGDAGELLATVSDTELAELSRSGVSYTVRIANLEEFYARRAAREGSIDDMGGYKTYSEIESTLDAIHASYPTLTTAKFSIGNSLEGNPIWCMKLSDNPETDEDEPEVLFTSLTHSREPAAMEGLFYFFNYLLDNYSAGSGNEATTLLDGREFYWIPCVNPDGYLYNEATNPGGGGMWRKNRRDNGDGSFGVDLNRNFGVNWGADDEGSSPDPSNILYRGSGPFSEPETDTLRQFIESRHFIAAMNYHTYSNLILYPWGTESYMGGVTPDDATFQFMGDSMQVLIQAVNGANYQVGTAWQVLYSVNGDANDWCYGEQTTKSKIFAFTIEVGSAIDGFWPPPSRILPLSQEMLPANLFFSSYAEHLIPPDQYIDMLSTDISESSGNGDMILNSGESGALAVSIKNIGNEALTDVQGQLTTVSPFVTVTTNLASFGSGAVSDTLSSATPFVFDVASGIPEPFAIEFELHLTAASGLDTTLSISGIVGPPVLSEDFENGADGWTHEAADGWGDQWHVSTEMAHSGTSSFKCGDAGTGDYGNSLDARLISPVIANIPEDATCTFWSWIDGERSGLYPDSAYDGGVVEISVDGGAFQEIVPVEGYTHTFRFTAGSFPFTGPMPGRACFSGTSDWRQYTLDLSAFANSDIQLRFRFGSDESLAHEGWYIDDVIVAGVRPVTVIPPSQVTIETSGTDVTLRWRADLNPAYRIFSDTIPDGVFSNFVGSTSDTSYTIPDALAGGELQFYRVVGSVTE